MINPDKWSSAVQYFEIWRRIVWYKFTSVSEEPPASIFMVEYITSYYLGHSPLNFDGVVQ